MREGEGETSSEETNDAAVSSEESDESKAWKAQREASQSRTRKTLGLGERNVTINTARASQKDRDEAKRWLPIYEEYADQRPKTRGDCVGGPRPCPWVSCVYNNYLDERQSGTTAGKSIILNFPDLEPDQVPAAHSCALDVADEGGATLEDVAIVMNLTRERVRQIQDIAFAKIGDDGALDQFTDGDEKIANVTTASRSRYAKSKAQEAKEAQNEESEESRAWREEGRAGTPVDDDANDGELTLGDGDTISFISDHPKADEIVNARMYRIYIRGSIDHGWEVRKKSRQERGLSDRNGDFLFGSKTVDKDD